MDNRETVILQNINFIITKFNILKCRVIEAAINEVKFRQSIFEGLKISEMISVLRILSMLAN
jgi:hypothetical protein